MMDMFNLASRLFGTSRAESNDKISSAVDMIAATGAGDSGDGSVSVWLDADVTPADDFDGDDSAIEIPTSPAVQSGDDVLIGLSGAGPMKVPVVLSNPGSGDRMAAQIDSAETLAEQAEAVANAIGQHFWHDENGAHVTEEERDDFEADHSGPNSLWNSLGMLFRDGLNNLLAILTSGIAIYDGNGNDASNILAEFMADHVRVGGNVPVGDGGESAIQFFDQTETHGSTMDAFVSVEENDTVPGYPFYDLQSTIGVRSTLADEGRVVDTGSKGEAALSLEQELSYGLIDSNEQFTEVHAALVADATYDKDALSPITSHASVRATATTDADGGLSYAELIGDAIGLGENEGNITYVRTPQVVVGVSQPEATYTGNDTTATASANGWTISHMNNVQGGSNVAGYFTFSNGVITALRNELLEISGVAYWNSGAVGQYGFGIFIGSSTVGSGTEKSVFNYKASASGQFSVVMPPRCVPVSAGAQIAVGRYSVSGSVYRNGNNMSFVTIRVVEDRSI